VITCPSCRKQNQDHYKFCLGCGAELPRPGSAPSLDETSPAGIGAVKAVEAAAPKAATPSPKAIRDEPTMDGFVAPAGKVVCPSCSHPNPPTNRFCASCGARMDQPAAAAPAAAVAAPPPKPAAPDGMSGITLVALSPDGTESGQYALPAGVTLVGRDLGGLFATDTYLSNRHATVTPVGDGVLVKDEGSLNGVFVRLSAEQRHLLAPGQIFRIGQELIEFEALDPEGPDDDGVEPLGSPIKGYIGRIAMVLGRKARGAAFPVPETGLSLGRERGEVLFSDDGYVSGLHCRLSYEDGQVYLTDLGSSNGTFVRVLSEEKLGAGEIMLLGQQLFRVQL
jgi:pSer/pThr/pTyr-binding forkhead associated (FHA) protein